MPSQRPAKLRDQNINITLGRSSHKYLDNMGNKCSPKREIKETVRMVCGCGVCERNRLELAPM
jgi:hypothetical protein